MKKKKDTVVQSIPRTCADKEKAVIFLEAQRWSKTPTCAHCESENVYQMKGRDRKRKQAILVEVLRLWKAIHGTNRNGVWR